MSKKKGKENEKKTTNELYFTRSNSWKIVVIIITLKYGDEKSEFFSVKFSWINRIMVFCVGWVWVRVWVCVVLWMKCVEKVKRKKNNKVLKKENCKS